MNPVTNTPSGVLLIDKAPDMTSHDVVAIARRQLKIKKIGHCGTLDPMATGLLMLVVGRATKIQDLLMSEDKEYVGTITLGATTSTQDKEGEVLEEKDVAGIGEEQVLEAFGKFTGEFEQMPPMVSAIKKDGVVRVDSFNVTRVAVPEIDFVVECTKGFYVRTYAHDIGQELGCGGHLSALRRTRSGRFNLERAIAVETLKTAPAEMLVKSLISLAEVSLMRGA